MLKAQFSCFLAWYFVLKAQAILDRDDIFRRLQRICRVQTMFSWLLAWYSVLKAQVILAKGDIFRAESTGYQVFEHKFPSKTEIFIASGEFIVLKALFSCLLAWYCVLKAQVILVRDKFFHRLQRSSHLENTVFRPFVVIFCGESSSFHDFWHEISVDDGVFSLPSAKFIVTNAQYSCQLLLKHLAFQTNQLVD